MQRVNRLVNLHVIRNLSTEKTKAPPTAVEATIDDLKQVPRNIFGTLSESGRNRLNRRLLEREFVEESSGHDGLEFDLEPRKNHYYYKYEITKYARQGSVGIRRALELFHEMKAKARIEPALENFSPLIYGCAKAGLTKRAFDLYDELIKYHGKPVNSIITCLINSCAESPFPDYALQRLDWFLKHLKIEFNRSLNGVQYNSAIKAYGKLGQLDKASSLIQEMVGNNVMPTIDTFNMLLIGCASNKTAGCSLALRVYKRIKVYDMKPNLVTYRLLLRCIRDCNMGSPRLVTETLKELPAMTSLSQRIEYSEKCARHDLRDRNKQALVWAPLITDLGKTFAEAVKVPEQADSATTAELDRKKAKPASDKSSSPTIVTPRNDKEEVDLMPVVAQQEMMLPNLLSSDHLSLMSRIERIEFDRLKFGFDRLMLFGGIHGYLATMIEDNCRPDNKTFSLLLTCIKPTKDNYLQYHKLAQEVGIKRDLVYYDLLIGSVCRLLKNYSRLELALHFVEQMHLDHLRPNISTFEALAAGCSDWKQARKLVDDVEKCGFIVSEVMIVRFFGAALERATANNPRLDYLNEVIKYADQTKFSPNNALVEKLEALRLRTNELILDQEKHDASADRKFSDKQVENFDEFRQLLEEWLEHVELKEEEHPWAQFHVEHGSKNANFRAYARQMALADRVKREALEKGEALGNVYQRSKEMVDTLSK